MAIQFNFNYEKTLQIIAHLLRKETTREMNYMRLLKIMYIADRESIRRCGKPITGDRVVAMKQGPVLSKTLDILKGLDIHSPDSTQYLVTEHYKVRLIKDPGNGDLNRFEVELLNEITVQYADNDEWDMVGITHEFEEWIKNDPGESSKKIPFIDILKAVGREDDYEAIQEDATFDNALSKLFP